MCFEQLIDSPIAFQRCFVRLGIGITGALMLSQAVYWSNRTSDGSGWFWKTIEEWSEETGLSRNEQDTAKRKLTALGIFEIKKYKVPARLHFKINFERLEELLIKVLTQQSSLLDSNKLKSRFPAKSIAEIKQTNTENTTDTTSNNITETNNSVNTEFASQKVVSDEMEVFCLAVMDNFNAILPELGLIKKLSPERKRLIEERYQQHPDYQKTEFWKEYFEFAKCCDLLIGKIPRKNGTIWKASFDWLLNGKNFRKVIEGKYYDDKRSL